MSSPWGSVLFRDRRRGGRLAQARGGLARYFLITLLPLVFLPLIFFALLAFQQAQGDLTQQINNQLNAIATLKENQINQWVTGHTASINNLAQAPDILQATRAFFAMPDAPETAAAEQTLHDRLEAYLSKNQAFEAFLLVHADSGDILLATTRYADWVGQSFIGFPAFVEARSSPILSQPVYEPRLKEEAITILAAAPVLDPSQGAIAILVGILDPAQLSDIVSPSGLSLGTTGRVYAVTRDGYAVGAPITSAAAQPDSLGIERAVIDRQDGNAQYRDPEGRLVLGSYQWLTGFGLALLVEQSSAEAYAPITRFATTLLIITAGTALFSVLVVLIFTRRLTRPIQELTTGAEQIAEGDFDVHLTLDRRDEIGLLAEAFNSMAEQMNSLYTRLEQRVAERTRQLSTAAEVAHAITSTLSLDELLTRAVELIRDRFGYYYASLFLLDESGDYAVLREGTGEVGARLKANGYRLAVGSQSLIGWVTANRQPRIALDVGADAVYLKNELLPDTRSEVVIPLRVGERVIGALDVQSQEPNAFEDADVEVLQTLADQIAIGFENGRLFARQSQVVKLEQLLSSLTSKIHQARQVDTLLENTATELGRALGARRVVVRLTPAADAEARPGNGHAAELSAPQPASTPPPDAA